MSKKLKTIFWEHKLFLLVLSLGLFMRIYRPLGLFYYSHDQDLGAWFYLDVFQNQHLRLVGQETSVQGVFIGPLFYYLLSIFYFMFNGLPVGGLVLVTLISLFAIGSVYYIFKSIFDKQVGLIAALLYSISFSIVFADREVVPTQPVLLWTVWYFYATWLILKSRSLGFVLTGVLWGLVWHLNLGLAVLTPIPILAWILSKNKKVAKKSLFRAVFGFFLFAFPLFAFELRHNFQQFRAIFLNSAATAGFGTTLFQKFDRVLQLLNSNAQYLLWGHVLPIPAMYAHALIIFAFIFLVFNKLISQKLALIITFWELVYLAFFSFNKINVSEYYLNGILIAWIAVLAIFINFLYQRSRALGLFLIIGFLLINVYRLLDIDINKSGYVQKRQLVSEISADAAEHGYPCVSVSYITKPGYELGYRYLFVLEDLHVNKPDSGSPVYTIVFPHNMVDKIDKSFGALGLIYPDHKRYSSKDIAKSCSGQNSNITDPMFGFTR